MPILATANAGASVASVRFSRVDRPLRVELLTVDNPFTGARRHNDFPTELWTLARVAKLIEREFAVTYSTVNVWRILREMGFSNPRPTGRAIQRDEAAIRQWRTKRWPALKKSPAAKGAPSSSSTKVD